MVMGMVRATSKGFKNVLRRARTNATSMAVLASETATPGISLAAIKAATAVRIILNNKFIHEFYQDLKFLCQAKQLSR
jgi:hypothetical protein